MGKETTVATSRQRTRGSRVLDLQPPLYLLTYMNQLIINDKIAHHARGVLDFTNTSILIISDISEKASQLYHAMLQLKSEHHLGKTFEEVGQRQQQRHLKEIRYHK